MDQLVSTEWLEHEMGEPDVRILDCTVFLRSPEPSVGSSPRAAYRAEPGRPEWEAGHIPHSGFCDQVVALSDQESPLTFTALAPEQLAAAFEAMGIGADTRVVLYDRLFNMWATRVWWLLRSIGFDNAAVLDGGWSAWTTDGRPTSISADPGSRIPVSPLVMQPRPGLLVAAEDVVRAGEDAETCLINALSPELHGGSDARYGRPGHIPGSANVYAVDLVDPTTHRYRPLDELRTKFVDAGALPPTSGGEAPSRVITWCGGGIAATSDAFILTMLGLSDVAVYDGSLSDWIARDLPLTNPQTTNS